MSGLSIIVYLTSFCVLQIEIQSPENRGQDFDVIEVDF